MKSKEFASNTGMQQYNAKEVRDNTRICKMNFMPMLSQ